MKTIRFSDAQRHMLVWLYSARRANTPAAHSARNVTLRALKRYGFVEDWVHPVRGCCWRLTHTGIDIAQKFDPSKRATT